jgi:hypothetical protein
MLYSCESEYARIVNAPQCTFHDARLVNGKLQPNVADLDMSLVGEGDATEEQVQLSC